MAATPFAAKAGRELGRLVDRRLAPPAPGATVKIPAHAGHVIIAGYGRVGQMLAQVLDAQKVPWIALDTDAGRVTRHHGHSEPVYLGDASRAELLHSASADSAQAIVITMDQPAAAHKAVHAVRRHYPRTPLFARARDEKHARQLHQAGATAVVPETLEASLQLAGHVLLQLGISDTAAAAILQHQRDQRALQPEVARRPGEN